MPELPDELSLPISSFEWPVPLVSFDPNTEPFKYVRFRAEWLPYVLGSLMQLMLYTTWDTTNESEIYLEQSRSALLIEQFVNGVELVQGPEGPQGPQGPQGVDGIDGTNGIDGVDGIDGTNGSNGSDGADGATGAAGPKIIGTIIPYATTSAPSGTLPCDGTIYLKSAYPDLVAVLNSVYFTDSTHFKTPDLRDRTMIGIGGNNGNGTAIDAGLTVRSQGDKVGAETHTLTAAQMPSHVHGTVGHTNTNVGGTANFVYQSATGNTLNTGSAGSDAAHNNMQPSIAVGFCIVATA